MLKYIIKRLLLLIPVFLGVSILVFTLMHLAPGDPIMNLIGEDPDSLAAGDYVRLREKLGLDEKWIGIAFEAMGT